MKIGFNMFLWAGHVTEEHQPIMATLKNKGMTVFKYRYWKEIHRISAV